VFGEAEPGEEVFEIGRERVPFRAHGNATGRDDNMEVFALGEQALGFTLFGEGEGDADADDIVDPRFESGRPHEVVHGRCEDDGIGFEKFLAERVGEFGEG